MRCAAVLAEPAAGTSPARRGVALRRSANDAECAAAAAVASRCSACHLHPLGRPCGLPGVDATRGSQLVFARRRIARGHALFEQGDEFRFIYAVIRGSFKSSITLPSGREQVCAFHLGGEVMALDGIACGRQATRTVAIDDSEVCSVAYAPLAERIPNDPGLQRSLSALMSREIVRSQGLMQLLSQMSAQQRLVTFLLDLSRRIQASGRSAQDFDLAMTRAEIGSYLGMALETVSRTLSLLRHLGVLRVDTRRIRIVDPDGLLHLSKAACAPAHRCPTAASLF